MGDEENSKKIRNIENSELLLYRLPLRDTCFQVQISELASIPPYSTSETDTENPTDHKPYSAADLKFAANLLE